MVAVTVLGGSAISLGFALAPLIGGATDPLDPRRFAVLGPRPTSLAAVLALVGTVSVPIAAVTALTVCAAIVWIRQGAAPIAAVAGGVLVVATCVLLARVCMALTALFLHERRSRELSGLFALAILVVVVPVGVFLASLDWHGVVPTQLTQAVKALAITPFGAATAFPGLLALGWPRATASLLVAVGTIAGLALIWVWLVRRALSTTERPASGREHGGLGWFAVAPGTPSGAVAARSLMYWLRDWRYLANLVIIPIAAGLTIVPLLIAGRSAHGRRPRAGAAHRALPRLASAQRHRLRLHRGVDAHRERGARRLRPGRPPRPDPAGGHSGARSRDSDRGLAARAVGDPARDGRRMRLPVPERARAVVDLVGGRAVSGDPPGREPLPAAAAHRARAARSRRPS